MDDWFYNLQNRLTDMADFQFYYNSNKHAPDHDSY
jgi:hypothetical protein